MKRHFSYFSKTIPPEVQLRTKYHICQHIAIFEPEEYAMGKVMCVDDFHFILFFSKAPVTRINNIEYRVKKGDMLVIQPWDEVYGVPCENIKFDKYMHIAVEKDFFLRIAKQVADGGTFEFKSIQNTYSNQLLDLIGNFQRELMGYGESFPLMVESICTQIVFQAIRDMNAETAGSASKLSKDNVYINKAIQYMHEYYNAAISINDICNLIYLSPCHFKRVFKECTGQTPHQYLLGIRMEKAKELLRTNEYTMEEISKLCGFVNSGHFSTVFKRNARVSPTDYRKMNVEK